MRIMQPLASLMALWRGRAGTLLWAVLVLEVLIFVYAWIAGAHTRVVGVVWGETTSSTGFLLALCAVEAFLAWRIWRGGSVAWFFLLFLVGISAGKTFAAVVSSFSPYSLGLLVLLFAQVTLLVSPAVRGPRQVRGDRYELMHRELSGRQGVRNLHASSASDEE